MLNFLPGQDIFTSGCYILVNPVNCAGVMGKGVALGVKRRWPGVFAEYREACLNGAIDIGRLQACATGGERPAVVVNFPTKRHWRNPSLYEYVGAGLESLRSLAGGLAEAGHDSMAVPMLGCGLGGLEWRHVGAIIARELGCLPMRIDVYGPNPAPEL